MKTNGGKINKLLIILFIQSFIVAIPANGMLLRRVLAKQIMPKSRVTIDFNRHHYSSGKNFRYKDFFCSENVFLVFYATCMPLYGCLLGMGAFEIFTLINKKNEVTRSIETKLDRLNANDSYNNGKYYKYKNKSKKHKKKLENVNKKLRLLNQQLLEEKTLHDKELEKNAILRDHIKANNHNNALAVAAIAAVIPITVMVNLFKEYL